VMRDQLEDAFGLRPWHGIQMREPFADVGSVATNVRKAYPGRRIVSLWAPVAGSPTFRVVLQGGGRVTVACDPSSGQVLGTFPKDGTWLDVILELHENLLAHRTGRIVNGMGACLLLLMCVTGPVLWWPGVRNWPRAIRVDFRRKWRRINFDLHSAAGFWSLLLISFWAASGIYFAWPREIFLFVNSWSPIITARPPAVSVTPEADPREPDISSLVVRARQLDPGTKWSGIDFPYSRRAPLGVLMRRGNRLGREYSDTVFFNPYNGEYLTTWRYGMNQTLGDWIIWSQVPLHFGTYWGFGVKLIWVAGGLAIPLLAVTGLVMYWNRVLRRKARSWGNREQRKDRHSVSGVSNPASAFHL
jgi:uncharacterized iron-regulated membrane protein